MQTFIEEVVQDLIDKSVDLTHLCLIVPSRRAAGVFRTALSKQLQKTVFAPKIYSIEDFIATLSELQLVSQQDLLFRFYTIYASKATNPETFDVFIGWAQTLLYDFNEIDRYLIDADAFFDYLNAIQELDHWSKNSSSSLIQEYLRFWNNLSVYYQELGESLQKSGLGYQGLQYRVAASKTQEYIAANPDVSYYFVGFNALNSAEQQIIQDFLSVATNAVYWDADPYFFSNPKHEVGLFFRTYQKNWNYYKTRAFQTAIAHYELPKNIRHIAVEDAISQAKYVGQLLAHKNVDELHKTALVLADETLLIPILNSLPAQITAVNVTMGIPLKQTPLASFIEAIFTLHKKHTSQGFYYKNIIAILRDPIGRLLFKNLGQTLSEVIHSENLAFVSRSWFKDHPDVIEPKSLLGLLFDNWQSSPETVINYLRQLLQQLRKTANENGNTLLLAYLFSFIEALENLSELNANYGLIRDLSSLIHFYRDIVATQRVDLVGDPKQGLQIMGVLESRLLDFEHVILTSVNEGTLPAGKSTNSYIPYDLKKSYGLPTYKEKDAIYAYHFYRLLQRATTVDILYATSHSGLGSTEKSRFLLQMELEHLHPIDSVVASTSIQTEEQLPMVIEKNEAMLSQLQTLVAHGLSPSLLTTYLRNPIKFYENYLLQLRDDEGLEEVMAANTMGTIIHNTLETLYTPYLQKTLTVAHIDSMVKITNATIVSVYTSTYGNISLLKGKNLLIYEVIQKYVVRFLAAEKSFLEAGGSLKILQLEKKLRHTLKHNALPYPVTFSGSADRIELRNGVLTIIDYKTGTVEKSDLTLSTWEKLTEKEGAYTKAFQVVMYAYLYAKSNGLTTPLQAGIISFKRLDNGFMPFVYNKNSLIDPSHLDAFEHIAIGLVAELCDAEIPFVEPDHPLPY